ncbi:spore germination protein [Bacillus sp. FJAT-45350]|uniref:spore germination protein n=1 Tax=Bacillus sp. FJAT-45350 TaxID=2011014 RepID=UPI000BB99941|nr:spore germination protein [Bacillus sp. FJAT-45350]
MKKNQQLEKSLQNGLLNEEEIKQYLKLHSDITFVSTDNYTNMTAFYCEGMSDTVQLNEYFHVVLAYISGDSETGTNHLPPISRISTMEAMTEKLFSGFLIFYKEEDSFFYSVDIAEIPQRKPEESKTEVSLKGPRDGFTEEVNVNVSLIRKRLKTVKLYNETFDVGSLSQTKVSLLYLGDKSNSDTIEEVRKRIEKIETESLISAGQLEQWIADRSFSLFPHFDYITRPDFAVESLLRGRFLIIVDGSPMILIGPINILALLKSPEDVHFPFHIVALQRLLRIVGLQVAIFLPGIYIAVTNVNLDQLPFSLLATIVISREGLPLSLPLEAFFILILFELLKEAGIRLPTAIGQTISIVGGLIIGDAAIRAGIASPTLLVTIALSLVATYTLVNQSLTGTVTILRAYSMLIATFLGVYGFFISLLSIVIYLSQLESFKLAYLEPISSINYKDFLKAFMTNPFNRKNYTSTMLNKRRR